MKKKGFCNFLMVFVFILLFSSCGGAETQETTVITDEYPVSEYSPQPTADVPADEVPVGGTPVRGIWNGNVYSNEYMGIYFYMPVGWNYLSDEEIAEDGGVVFGEAGHALTDEYWDSMGSALTDMVASNPFTVTIVKVIIQQFPQEMTAEDYIQIISVTLGHMDMEINTDFPQQRIGAYYWYSIEGTMEISDTLFAMRYFINVSNGFTRTIVLNGEPETIAYVLQYIGDFNDTPSPSWTPEPDSGTLRSRRPSLGQPPEDHPLVGAWAWDSNSSYVYNFNPDGTGTRGFPNNIQSFTWEVEDDHVIMRTGQTDESWTFTIAEDTLTIDMRQVTGITFSYIRVNAPHADA